MKRAHLGMMTLLALVLGACGNDRRRTQEPRRRK